MRTARCSTWTAVLALLPTGGRVLEVACGTGQWTQHLAGRFADVTALDTSADALAIAQTAGARGGPVGPGGRVPVPLRGAVRPGLRRLLAVARAVERVAAVLVPAGCPARARRGRRVRGRDRRRARGKETWSAGAEDVVTRSVADGRTFQVAKLRLDPVAVTARLADLGWR